MKICRQEVLVRSFPLRNTPVKKKSIEKVNDSDYGLQAGLFTTNLGFAMKAAKRLKSAD